MRIPLAKIVWTTIAFARAVDSIRAAGRKKRFRRHTLQLRETLAINRRSLFGSANYHPCVALAVNSPKAAVAQKHGVFSQVIAVILYLL